MDKLTNICEATSQSHDVDSARPVHRKGKKLLAEKKRRARINNCLLKIRRLVCDDQNNDDTDIDKMEKAEILEKTLEVLTKLRQDHQPSSSSTSNTRKALAFRYASGFSSCAEESIRYIQNSRLVPNEVKLQLKQHLRAVTHRVTALVQGNIHSLPSASMSPTSTTMVSPSTPDCWVRTHARGEGSEPPAEVDSSSRLWSPDLPRAHSCYILPTPVTHSTPRPKPNLPPTTHRHLLHQRKPKLTQSMSDTTFSKQARHFTNLPGSRQATSTNNSSKSDSGYENSAALSLQSSHLTDNSNIFSSLVDYSPMSAISPFGDLSSAQPRFRYPSPLIPTPPAIAYSDVISCHGYRSCPTSPCSLDQNPPFETCPPLVPSSVTTASGHVTNLCVTRTRDSMWRPW